MKTIITKNRNRIFFLAFVFLLAGTANAQLMFQKTYGGFYQDYCYDMHKMPTGGYVLGGITFSYPNPYGKSYVVRTDVNGDTLWTASFGDTTTVNNSSCNFEYINDLCPMNDGGVVACGGKLTCDGSGSGHITRLDANGNVMWAKVASPGGEDPYPVIQAANGNIIVGGYVGNGTGAGMKDGCLAELDAATGDTIWSRTYGGASGDEWFYHIIQTPDGGYLASGFTTSFGQGRDDIYLVKTDANGNLMWSKSYGTPLYNENAFGHSLQQTSDGGFIVSGSGDSVQSARGIFLMKLDANGNMSWAKYFTGKWAHAVKQTADHGYILAGQESAADTDVVLIKTDSAGTMQWSKTYGGSGAESGWLLELADDGGYVTGGWTTSFGSGSEDQYLVKTDANGNSGCNDGNPVIAESAAPFIATTPATIVLHGIHTMSYPYSFQRGATVSNLCSTVGMSQPTVAEASVTVYPNPFSSQTTIGISNAEKIGNAHLKIFDVLGQEVLNMTFGNEQVISIDRGNLKSGIYFYEVSDGNKMIGKGKMVVE